MKLIKLTYIDKTHIYINPDHIGHIYEVEEENKYGHTVIGVTTHNNGGFRVIETIKQIQKLIEE